MTTGIHVVFKRIKLIFRLEFEKIFIPQQPVEVQTDPSKCAFGKFFVSEEMNAQAETMKSFSGELVVMVGGPGI